MDKPLIKNPLFRIMASVKPSLYVTGYSGFDSQEINPKTPPGTMLLPDQMASKEQYLDVAVVDRAKHEKGWRAMVYLGLSSERRDFTCYLEQVGTDPADKNSYNRILGLYAGDGVAPQRLDEKYVVAMPEFEDGQGYLIWQYQINELLAAQARIPALLEGTMFAGDIFFREYALPKMVLGAVVRADDGTSASLVQGWLSDTGDKGDVVPNESTLIPLGSITKALTGHLLARMVVNGKARLTDLAHEAPAIRLVDLATQTSGLPRDAALTPLPPVLFPPGTGALYSNIGFNLLSKKMYEKQPVGTSFFDLLKLEVLSPLGLHQTSYAVPLEPLGGGNVFTGRGFDGKPWEGPRDDTPRGASGLYSTPRDILKWLEWHLQQGGDVLDQETRLLNHAAYVQRDGLNPVVGLDESGHMDAMGLGWVVMMPQGDRPFILQKAGGTTGVFSFVAFSPKRGIGFFISIDQWNVGAGTKMAQLVADLITNFAPR